MEPLTIAFAEEHEDEPIIVESPEELDRALDSLVAFDPEHRVLAQILLRDDPWHAIFEVGVHNNERGIMYHSGEETEDGVVSTGGPEGDPVLYFFVRADREFPTTAEVPIAKVREAVHEFLRTGGRLPTVVDWEPAN